jgi:glucans biosynthesis protein C
MVTKERIYGLDMLRGVAMLLGIVLHGSIAYKQGYHHGEWAFDPNYNSYFFDWLFLWINSFRMQLFFLLAGFFAALLIYRKGTRTFLENRFKRLAIPLVVCYFTILPLTLLPYLYVQFQKTGEPWTELKKFFPDFFTFKAHSGLMHLWFLQHLIVFCILTGAFVAILRSRFFRKLAQRFISRVSELKLLFYPFTAIITCCVFLISLQFDAALPFIWTGFIIPIPQFLYYGFFFGLGWLLHYHKDFFHSLKHHYLFCTIAGTLLSIAVVIGLNVHPNFLENVGFRVGLKLAFSLQTILLTIGLIGVFLKFFDAPTFIGQYISSSAYWVYLIHMPIMLGLQLILISSPVPGLLRFPIVIIGCLFLSFVSYHYLVRSTWIGLMLNGKR